MRESEREAAAAVLLGWGAWGVREKREGAGGAAPFGGWDGGAICGAHMLEKRGPF